MVSQWGNYESSFWLLFNLEKGKFSEISKPLEVHISHVHYKLLMKKKKKIRLDFILISCMFFEKNGLIKMNLTIYVSTYNNVILMLKNFCSNIKQNSLIKNLPTFSYLNFLGNTHWPQAYEIWSSLLDPFLEYL